MEFANTGAHCSLDSCRQHDYLPFTCTRCTRQFCLSHRTRESHECPSLASDAAAASGPPPPPPVLPNKYKCHTAGCRVRELQPISCRNCAHQFCIRHRFPTSHDCEAKFGRNTILKAGLVPPRPLNADLSSDHSRTPVTVAATRVDAAPTCAAEATAAAVSAPALPLVSSSSLPPSTLLRSTSGNSCAAELAASSTQSALSSVSSCSLKKINSESIVPPPSTNAAPRKPNNTNLAHLSKLLKQTS